MNRMRKCNDEVYQLAKDQALVKKLKNKRFRPFCLCLPGVTLAKLCPEPPVVAFRRPKSIKDTLVRAAVSRPSSTVDQYKPCGDKCCKCCLQLQHAQVFHSKTTGKEYKTFCNVNCKTPNVAYLLDCDVCG